MSKQVNKGDTVASLLATKAVQRMIMATRVESGELIVVSGFAIFSAVLGF